jgi:hypothetical protein
MQRTSFSASFAIAAVFIALLFGIPLRARADSFIFEKIADFNTVIPAGKKTFTGLHSPSIDDHGQVVFKGRGKSGQRGIYIYKGGILAVVADGNTVLPGGAEFLTAVHDLSMNNNGQVVFEATGSSGQQGIYLNAGGSLAVVADRKTAIPGGSGNLISLSAPFISDQGEVLFRGDGENDQHGIYNYTGGILAIVADTKTAIPAGKKFFVNFRHLSMNRSGQVVFIGKGHSEQRGIYLDVGDRLMVVANYNTAIPDGSKTFQAFRKPSIDAEGRIAFKAKGKSGQRGIYTDIEGNLAVVADRNTAIPGGAGNFSLFGIPSIDNGQVAFTASGDDQGGLYTTLGGSLTKVLSLGETLAGKTVTSIIFQPDGLSGNNVVFKVIFDDSSKGIYRALLAASGSSS